MNYIEALEYIHGVSWTFCKPGLERIGELCERLGHPEKKLKFIHVAGTNGKGSASAMLDSVLREAGYKTGLYTSPYIRVFNERMRINGENISNEELAELTEYIKPIADKMVDSPTEFELITALAFEYFARNNCDVVVLEAGMGGRLDSTNIIDTSVLSIITGIALDHTAFLGDTIEKIAAEKAGIIKENIPILYGGTDESAKMVIKAKAKEMYSQFESVDYAKLNVKDMSLGGTTFDFGQLKDLKIKLLGSYQPRNVAIVVRAIDLLREKGFKISDEALRSGFLNAKWQGRFEILSREPLIIFDGAHNPQGIEAAVESIKLYFKEQKVCIVTGVLRDKDYTHIAKMLATVASKAFTFTPDSPRALNAEDYAQTLSTAGISAEPFATVRDALSKAKKYAMEHSCPIICVGSLYAYAEIVGSLC
ncbi:MAG: bifunctional folylpolyglutamate synthase/dihydrofolate synthase [Ruminococcaceae bacterium]|nr:bifunctional folylpolyglutamate synthase/dihydrofolate synthase [Oscillospiraceae bacterium]